MAEIPALLARCTFPPSPGPVVCAVSGGPDSLALLALAVEAGLTVTAVHVDHGLRPGSAGEAAVVRRAAQRFGAEFRAERVIVEAGPNLEARARSARYAVLPPDVLTGHTADDQAETMLLNLLRGAGTRGLAGMRPGGRPGRPILGLRRAETRALVTALDLEVVDDPSNADLRHRRNRVRLELLPLIDAIADRDVGGLLARQSRWFRDDDDLLDELASDLDPADARALTAAPPALARRAVRRWLTEWNAGYPPDAASVDRVLEVARGGAVACEIPGGHRVVRRARRLSVQPAPGTASAPRARTQYTRSSNDGPGAGRTDRREGEA